MKVQIEEVSPQQAEAWLKLSKGNRRIQDGYALSLAVAMEQGAWVPEASEVVFDEAGALIDGHHRLTGVVIYGKPVRMAVKRGVPAAARNVIDTGRTRSMSDLLGMYRSVDYANWRRAALNQCVDLLVTANWANRPQIRTLDAYDQWMKHFRDGIEWATAATLQGGHPQPVAKAFGRGPFLGAFAFAHKLNPDGVEKFHVAAMRGEGLKVGDPAMTLRTFALAGWTTRSHNGGQRRDAAIKTLCALHAELHGHRMMKLIANAYALPYFRSAYKSRSVDKLVEPWETPEVAQKSESV